MEKPNAARVFERWNKWRRSGKNEHLDEISELIMDARITEDEFRKKFCGIEDPDNLPRMLGESFQIVDNFLENGYETRHELNRAFLYLTCVSNVSFHLPADLEKIREALGIDGLKRKYGVVTDPTYKIRIHEKKE